jgi:thioredoxin-like negative regulator of GroEL
MSLSSNTKLMSLALVVAVVAYCVGIAILSTSLTGCTAPDPKQAFNPMGKAVEELNKKAQAAIEANKLDEADKLLSSAKTLMPENTALAFNLAVVQLSEGKLTEAEKAFKELKATIPAELSERLTLKQLEVASQILEQLEHPENIVAKAGKTKAEIEQDLLNGMTKSARIATLRCDIQKAFKTIKTAKLKDSAKPWMAGMKNT